VLRWAATLAVLGMSAVILLAFAYQLAAERALAEAAAAGLREATLPRATSRSVENTVRRHLTRLLALDRATTVLLEHNGAPRKGAVRPQSGDQLSLTLSAPTAAVLPRWLPILSWGEHAAIKFRIDHRVDGS
jgi:hypothetical protein